MTAALTDERLAELRERLKAWRRRPEIAQRVVDDLDDCLCELQAYRAKRETHVWVPKGRGWACDHNIYSAWSTKTRQGKTCANCGEQFDVTALAASDGNPP